MLTTGIAQVSIESKACFVAKAPGIAPGRLERTISILDFTPTITRLLGIDFNVYDGQPIAELLSLAAAVPVARRHLRP